MPKRVSKKVYNYGVGYEGEGLTVAIAVFGLCNVSKKAKVFSAITKI